MSSSRESAPVASSLGPAGSTRVAVSSIAATLAFWAYTQTLLPGVDLGDTGGFQAAVLWPEVSARQAYPLYYALAKPFVAATTPQDPARALNLFSAIWAAVSVGIITFLCATVTRSIAGGAVAGLLLAFSYTFWTQAIIAEVYALHLALVGACLASLHGYAVKPTGSRLALFFAVYAVSFGNHLGMILLLVPFAVFLAQASPHWRDLFRARIVVLALLVAAAGALQYWPNFMAVWGAVDAPDRASDRIAAFWFDVTKQDWRESMVMGVRGDQMADRLAMWWFDARQQFGIFGVALALAGAVALWRLSRIWAVLAAGVYGVCTAFALTYNVGDSHVFFLPGHYISAFCAGAAVAFAMRRGIAPYGRTLAASIAIVALVYAGWRGWSTWPAVDRHADRRGDQLIERLSRGVDDQNAVLVSRMNWQLENVLLYAGRYRRPDVTWVRLDDVLRHFPSFVNDNHAIGRDIVLTADAAAEVVAAYDVRFAIVEDVDAPGAALIDAVARIPAGAPYVLCVLTPPRDELRNPVLLDSTLETLTGGKRAARADAAYELFAGLAGEPPQIHRASSRPFQERFRIAGDTFLVRLDSWLPLDTFRRPGFGHVLRGRDHLMILERGVNLVWLGRDGGPLPPLYAASLFAPMSRYRIAAGGLRFARVP